MSYDSDLPLALTPPVLFSRGELTPRDTTQPPPSPAGVGDDFEVIDVANLDSLITGRVGGPPPIPTSLSDTNPVAINTAVQKNAFDQALLAFQTYLDSPSSQDPAHAVELRRNALNLGRLILDSQVAYDSLCQLYQLLIQKELYEAAIECMPDIEVRAFRLGKYNMVCNQHDEFLRALSESPHRNAYFAIIFSNRKLIYPTYVALFEGEERQNEQAIRFLTHLEEQYVAFGLDGTSGYLDTLFALYTEQQKYYSRTQNVEDVQAAYSSVRKAMTCIQKEVARVQKVLKESQQTQWSLDEYRHLRFQDLRSTVDSVSGKTVTRAIPLPEIITSKMRLCEEVLDYLGTEYISTEGRFDECSQYKMIEWINRIRDDHATDRFTRIWLLYYLAKKGDLFPAHQMMVLRFCFGLIQGAAEADFFLNLFDDAWRECVPFADTETKEAYQKLSNLLPNERRITNPAPPMSISIHADLVADLSMPEIRETHTGPSGVRASSGVLNGIKLQPPPIPTPSGSVGVVPRNAFPPPASLVAPAIPSGARTPSIGITPGTPRIPSGSGRPK